MSENSSLMQIQSPIQQNGHPRFFEPMSEKDMFYENFLNYREISSITIRSYVIRKQRFSEYAVF